MRNLALQTLADQIAADRTISADEALELRKAVFPDGVVSREEAELLMSLAARVANSDDAWMHAFVEALVDHVMGAGTYPGHVDEATASWLIARFGRDGPRETEVEALLKVVERSESAPDALSVFARERIAALLAGQPIGAPETELVRRCLYASSGSGATSVIEAEARWLFALDAESDGRANDASWGDLFVKAALNHLMGRRAPAMLEAKGMLARQSWLNTNVKRPPGAMLLTMFEGGLGRFREKARYSEVDNWETHYEHANAESAEDEKLTLSEIAWAVGMTKEDGKRTANEEALLAEIRKLEQAPSA